MRTRLRPLPSCLGALLSCALLSSLPTAQTSFGGRPLSSLVELPGDVPVVMLGEAGSELETVALGPQTVGRWQDVHGGGRLWRLRVGVHGASGLMLVFSRFQLPAGASLFVYDDERAQVRGAFTELSNRADGRFELEPTPGDTLTLEYHEPSGVSVPVELVLEAVLPVYVPSTLAAGPAEPAVSQAIQRSRSKPELVSPPCNVDVACPEGEGWEIARRSVVAIVVPNEFCTGVLLNNTAEDGTPYVLTARHCGSLNLATFRFNWWRAECDPESLPARDADMVAGSELVASDPDLDFQLVRLSAMPPPEFGALYAGWDRSGEIPERTACLHHPVGDYMKVSLDADPPRERKQHWFIGRWDSGMTHRGSSGAPLFDPAQRMIGSLEGGDSTCKSPTKDYFVRFARMWNALEPVLDPFGTGAAQLDAFDPADADLSFAVVGTWPAEPTTEQREIEIRGRGFTGRLAVRLDGEKLDWRTYRAVANSRIAVELPELKPGKHVLKVVRGPEAGKIQFTVTAPPAEDADAPAD